MFENSVAKSLYCLDTKVDLGEGGGERERESEQKVKSEGVVRQLFIWVGEKEHHLEGSQASPARPSVISSI